MTSFLIEDMDPDALCNRVNAMAADGLETLAFTFFSRNIRAWALQRLTRDRRVRV